MGSVNKRGDSWQVRWRESTHANPKSKTFRRKVDADRFLIEVEHQLQTGSYISPHAGRLTVGEWWAKWSGLQHQWSAGTRERHAIMWSKHVAPSMSGRELRSVLPSDLQGLIVASGLAPSTTKLLRSLLASMFGGAVSDGLLARSPAVGLKVAKDDADGPRPLSLDQQAALIDACDAWERAWVLFGLSTGVRISEGLGVRLGTVDLMRGLVRVGDQARTPQSGAVELAPLKNRRPRSIPFGETLRFVLARHIEVHGTGAHGALFADRDGQLYRRQAAHHRFMAIAKRAGLDPSISWHNLRDTAATTMLRDGMNPAEVARILGNTVPVLLTRYAGAVPDDFELARTSLDRLASKVVAI